MKRGLWLNIRYNQRMIKLTQVQIEQLQHVALAVGDEVMSFYTSGFDVQQKSDNSPVTQADLAASELLERELPQIANYPVLSEESVPETPLWKTWKTYWLIDPIDGTKHFINRTGEFCICIALIHQNRAVLGLIYAPTNQTAWLAQVGDEAVSKYENGEPVALTPTLYTTSGATKTAMTATISANHLSDKMATLLKPLGDFAWHRRGSALKYIDIIEGKATIYPKLWDTCEWDSAAGQCLVEVAGGQVLDVARGQPLRYGQNEGLINPHFIAFNHVGSEQVQAILQQYQQLKADGVV